VSASITNSSWHLFIGKLAVNTTEKELSDYLEDNGISVEKVSKLKPLKNGMKRVLPSRCRYRLSTKMTL
jgi:hypothetical protein